MILIFNIFILPNSLISQTLNLKNSNPDSLFIIANNYTKSGELELSRKICFSVLENYPDYTDFLILAGRTLAWENKFDSAKNIVDPILKEKPQNIEAILLLADIEIWQKQFNSALAYVDSGLINSPDDIQLIEKRSEILKKMASIAFSTPISYGVLYPDSNSFGVSYFFEFFKKPYIARRHMISTQYTKITPFAPLSFRFNIADNILNNKFFLENPSYQLEIDAYPKLDEKSYLYLNYGIGNGSFFPSHKIGVEYFKGINDEFEFSIGSRYMYWDNSIYFLTGSISKYIESYWLSFRPYFSIKNNNFSDAYIFETRRYFGIYNSYLFGLVIFGDSPDQPLTLAQEYGNFKSVKYVTGIQHRISKIQVNSSFGIQREEYLLNKYRLRTEYIIGINYVF